MEYIGIPLEFHLAKSLKGAIQTYNFTNCLKLSDITPLQKKGRKDNKGNYRPVSILPALSIVGAILFNIFLADLFFVVKDIDIASYADDRTPFIVENNIDNVIASLEQVCDALFNWFKINWFKINRLKSNVDKCHVLVSTNKPVGIKIGDFMKDT